MREKSMCLHNKAHLYTHAYTNIHILPRCVVLCCDVLIPFYSDILCHSELCRRLGVWIYARACALCVYACTQMLCSTSRALRAILHVLRFNNILTRIAHSLNTHNINMKRVKMAHEQILSTDPDTHLCFRVYFDFYAFFFSVFLLLLSLLFSTFVISMGLEQWNVRLYFSFFSSNRMKWKFQQQQQKIVITVVRMPVSSFMYLPRWRSRMFLFDSMSLHRREKKFKRF